MIFRLTVLVAAVRATPAYRWHLYQNESCSDFDDDGVYTSVSCSSYDEKSCETYCLGSEYCAYLCGAGTESCDTGSGATCAMYALGRLTETCQSVDSMPNYPSPLPDGVLEKDATTGGCDSHAYCTFCEPFEQCRKTLRKYAPKVLGEEAWKKYAKIGKGPLAMVMLANISAICNLFSIDELQKQGSSQAGLQTSKVQMKSESNLWDRINYNTGASAGIFLFCLLGATAFVFAAVAIVFGRLLPANINGGGYERVREDPNLESAHEGTLGI